MLRIQYSAVVLSIKLGDNADSIKDLRNMCKLLLGLRGKRFYEIAIGGKK